LIFDFRLRRRSKEHPAGIGLFFSVCFQSKIENRKSKIENGTMKNDTPSTTIQPASSVSPAVLALVVLAALAGLAGRLWLTSLAPRWAYLTDHLDNIQMGRAASAVQDSSVVREIGKEMELRRGAPLTVDDFARFQDKGLTRQFNLFHVYSMPPEKLPLVWADDYQQGKAAKPVMFPRIAIRQVNYPPLGETVFWLQSSLLEAAQPGRPVNTFTSRLIMSLASVLGEILAAIGAYLVARRFLSKNLALVAGAACWLLPPMAMDSSFWGQTDSWFVAPALFTIWLMFRGRWVAAGILSAITVLLKPQGIFLGPIILFAAAVLPAEGEVPLAIAFFKRVGRSVGAGAATLIVLSLPWTIADGKAWIDQAYIGNFALYGETTLKAFNVWYLDALLHDGDLSPVLDPEGTILGIAKGSWGTLLTAASLFALGYLYYRKYPRSAASPSSIPRPLFEPVFDPEAQTRREPQSRRQTEGRPNRKGALAVMLFSALWLWSTFLWPTKVHERYITYAIPLVVLCAFGLRRLWPAAIVLVLVGSAELCHNVWLNPAAGYLVHPRTVTQVYDEMRIESQARRLPMPTRDEALRYVQAGAEQQRAGYLRQRQSTEGLEYLLTLGCILGYAWAFACPFLKLGKADVEEEPPKSRHGPQPRRK